MKGRRRCARKKYLAHHRSNIAINLIIYKLESNVERKFAPLDDIGEQLANPIGERAY